MFFQAYGSSWIGSGQIPSRDVPRIGQFGSEDPSEGGQTEWQMFTAFLRYKSEENEVNATVYVTRAQLGSLPSFSGCFLAVPMRSRSFCGRLLYRVRLPTFSRLAARV